MRFFALFACICAAAFALQSRVLATDSSLAWTASFDAPTSEFPALLTVDTAGNVFVVNDQVFNLLGYYWFVHKLDPNGHLLWSQSFISQSFPQDLAVDANGDLYITGATAGALASNVLVLAKYNPNGQLLWLKSLASAEGQSLHIDSAGNIFVGGKDDSAQPPKTLLVEYNTDGQIVSQISKSEVSPSGSFFLANGNLVSSGTNLTTSNPAYEVYSSSGTPVFGGFASNGQFDSFTFRFGSDSASDLFVATIDFSSLFFTSSFVLSSTDAVGNNLWTTPTQSEGIGALTASDPNHAYVLAFSGNTVSYQGFGSGGNQFMNAPGTNGLIVADGTTGLVSATVSSTSYTLSEISPNQQTLWSQIGSGSSLSPMSLEFGSGNAYATFQQPNGSLNGTLLAKVTLGVGLKSLTSGAANVQGGNPLGLTILLNDAAPAGGFAVALSGSAAFIGLPSQIALSAGKSSASFNVKTLPVDAPTPVTIFAQANGVTRSTTVTVMPASLSSLTFPGGSSATVKGGQTITGTIQLSGITGLAGRAVALSSNNASATVPAQVVVQPGTSTVNFTVQTSTVTASTAVKITANVSGGSSKSASFTINP